jgi:hypothetical protein
LMQTKGCARIMAVELPRKNWPDDRIDELSKRVGAGFAKVDERFKEVDKKVDAGFAKVDERFKEVDKRFDKARDEMKSEVGGLRVELMALHRLLLRASIGGAVAVGVLLLGMLAGHT